MIKYLGSKRLLVPAILETVAGIDGVRSVLDPFSGTARVAAALKRAGYRVIANDHNAYAATLARGLVGADRTPAFLRRVERLLGELSRLPGRPGWFTENYCVAARYFRPENGERIEAIRDAIAAKALEPDLEAVVLTSLLCAADRVDSTTGVQMAYLKRWASRAGNALELRVPELLPRSPHGRADVTCLDAVEAAAGAEVDLAYLDPPYNQHSYLGNYHVWETLVRWDRPEVYGVARKRVDCRTRRSAFNSKRGCRTAFRALLAGLRARVVVVSMSDEGHLAPSEIEADLGTLWGGTARVEVRGFEARRYVGARIGIHNPAGVKVGKVSHLENREFLFTARPG